MFIRGACGSISNNTQRSYVMKTRQKVRKTLHNVKKMIHYLYKISK